MAVAINKKSRQRLHAFACNLIGRVEDETPKKIEAFEAQREREALDRVVRHLKGEKLSIRDMLREEAKWDHEMLWAWLHARLEGDMPKPYPFQMNQSNFPNKIAPANTANLTAITATSETVMWPVASFTQIPALSAWPDQEWELIAYGIYSTSTSGTLTLTPRYGTTSGGTALGTSIAQTVPVSLTNEGWFMHGSLDFVTVNNSAATQSTCTFGGLFDASGVAGTAASSCVIAMSSASPVTVDTTSAQGLYMGWTLSVAGSCTPVKIRWRVW
jgi:hypothetical protein